MRDVSAVNVSFQVPSFRFHVGCCVVCSQDIGGAFGSGHRWRFGVSGYTMLPPGIPGGKNFANLFDTISRNMSPVCRSGTGRVELVRGQVQLAQTQTAEPDRVTLAGDRL